MRGNLALVGALLVSTSLAAVSPAMAQVVSEARSADAPDIIVTGTRQTGITAAESATPIRLVGADAISTVGQPNLNQVLTQLLPSFVAEPYNGDAANAGRLGRLRGLNPNHTLVLVNGKRRHSTANLHALATAFQGAASPDLDLISSESIKRIEVLEQGAAAQYGSDAIAGVINIILKDDREGGSGNVSAGQYFKSDGETYSAAGNIGIALGETGFLNLTAFHRYHNFSVNGGGDIRLTDQNDVLLPTLSPAQRAIYPNQIDFPHVDKFVGDPRSHLTNLGFNSGADLGDAQVYLFGTYSRRLASSQQSFRTADRVIASSVLGVPGTLTSPDALIFAPRGFTPILRTVEDDFGLTGGVKGNLGDWRWDASATWGQDKIKLFGRNTVNASLFVDQHDTRGRFYDGSLRNEELTLNLDIARDFELGMAGPLTLAFGSEYRHGAYEIGMGDAGSVYKEGAQGFAGFTATDAGTHNRSAYSGYVDIAATPVDGLKLNGSARYEHYSDFGSTTNVQFTGRYDVSPAFALRGTVGTGFRAPSLAEEYYSTTNVTPTTANVQLPPNSPAAQLVGFAPLKPEKSRTISFGGVIQASPLVVTIDAYQIRLRDRVVRSGIINGKVNGVLCDPATNPAGCPLPGQLVLDAIAAHGNVLDPSVNNVSLSVFTNGINSRTRGLDVTASYPWSTDFGEFNLTLSGSYNKTKITKITISPILLDTTARSLLEDASPRWKAVGNLSYKSGPFSLVARETIYGKSSITVRAGGDYPYLKNSIPTTGITDLEVGYDITKAVKFSVGADNLFDKRAPKILNQTRANGTGLRPSTGTPVWDAPLFIAPWGINGGYYYARLGVTF